ncbi:MAG TPA: lipoprotein insertase outer membrane protein LolB [Burkholderiales bacterium]|nr:lipoprotein insertase outer membrane protein LolB [Burkholderiales bacterium]
MLRLALCVAAAAFVGACTTLPGNGVAPPGGFELSGRVAVHSVKDSGSARIFWRHSSDSDEMLITSPVGQTIARIRRDNGVFRLETGDRQEYRASDAESLTEQALGWRLPLAGLSDWIQGRASPDRPAEVSGQPGNGLDIRQDGWSVAYEEFREGKPSRLRLSREGVEIRLVVDQWSQ